MNHLFINPPRHNIGNLSVTRTLLTAPDVYSPGDTLTYELSVTNVGNGLVTDVLFSDSHITTTYVSGNVSLSSGGVSIVPEETITIQYSYDVTLKDVSDWLVNSIPLTGEAEVTSSVGTYTTNNTEISPLTSFQYIFDVNTDMGNFEPSRKQNVFVSIGRTVNSWPVTDFLKHWNTLSASWDALRNDYPTTSDIPFYLITNSDDINVVSDPLGVGFSNYNSVVVPTNVIDDSNAYVIQLNPNVDSVDRLVTEIIDANNLSAGSVIWMWEDEFASFAEQSVKSTSQWSNFIARLASDNIRIALSGPDRFVEDPFAPQFNYIDYHREVASDITITTDNRQFMLPLINTGTYDFYVDWGDNTGNYISSYNDINKKHTYSSAGDYTISITGQLDGWFFNDHNRLKYKGTRDWTALTLIDYNSTAIRPVYTEDWNLGFPAFASCVNYTGRNDAIGSPTVQTTDLSYMFAKCFYLQEDGLGAWNVSNVVEAGHMFEEARSFSEYLGEWNTSSFIHVNDMFSSRSETRSQLMTYNKNLGNWNMRNVEDLSKMFYANSSYNNDNQSLDWQLPNCQTMYETFRSATNFNTNINSWGPYLSGVTEFSRMFMRASNFNQPLDLWNTSSALNIQGIFEEASSFNQSLNNWDVSDVNNFESCFLHASAFNNGKVASDLTDKDNWEFDIVESSVGAPSFESEYGSCIDVVNDEGFAKYYVLGGVNNATTPVYIYDPGTNLWSTGSNHIQYIHHFQAVKIDKKIYVVCAYQGAFPNDSNVDNVYVYDTEIDSWSQSHSIPVARRRGAAATAVYNGKIYVVGGNDGGHNTSSNTVAWFDEYNPTTGTWTQLTDAPTERDHAKAVVVGDKLYIIGGRDSSADPWYSALISSVDVYDFNTSTWTTLANDLPTPRSGIQVALFKNGIFVMGGDDGSNALDTVEVLDTRDDTWSTYPSLEQARHGGEAFVNNESVVLMGGMSQQGGNGQLDPGSSDTTLNNFIERGTPGLEWTWDVSKGKKFNFFLANWNSDLSPTGGSFNQKVTTWKPLKAENLIYTFATQFHFNSPLNSWGPYLSGSFNNSATFAGCERFNQNLDTWNVSSCSRFTFMFKDCYAFNNGYSDTLSAWDISNIQRANQMFNECHAFNQSLDNWEPVDLQDSSYMFNGNLIFNKPLSGWSLHFTGSLKSMEFMFFGCHKFNQDLTSWGPYLSNVETANALFHTASSFNNGSVAGASDRPLDWSFESLKNGNKMFKDCYSFNQPLNYWNGKLKNLTNISGMFDSALVFNQNIDGWGPALSGVTTMERVFFQAHDFNQPISSWDVRNVNSMEDMLTDPFFGPLAFSQANYDSALNSWANLAINVGVKTNVDLDVDATRSSASVNAYNTLSNVYGWNITDGGLV